MGSRGQVRRFREEIFACLWRRISKIIGRPRIVGTVTFGLIPWSQVRRLWRRLRRDLVAVAAGVRDVGARLPVNVCRCGTYNVWGRNPALRGVGSSAPCSLRPWYVSRGARSSWYGISISARSGTSCVCWGAQGSRAIGESLRQSAIASTCYSPFSGAVGLSPGSSLSVLAGVHRHPCRGRTARRPDGWRMGRLTQSRAHVMRPTCRSPSWQDSGGKPSRSTTTFGPEWDRRWLCGTDRQSCWHSGALALAWSLPALGRVFDPSSSLFVCQSQS